MPAELTTHIAGRTDGSPLAVVAYLLRRLLLGVSIVWAISFGAFVSFGLSFDPTYPLILGGRNNPQRLALIAQYHLHDPILERYWLWLTGLFRHGFGTTVLGPRGYGGGVEIGPSKSSAVAEWIGAGAMIGAPSGGEGTG